MGSWLRDQRKYLQLSGRPARRGKVAESLDPLPMVRPHERQKLPTEQFSPIKNCRRAISADGAGRR